MEFGFCACVRPAAEPQTIELSEEVANRLTLTPRQYERAQQIVDGNVVEVDWDVGKISSPIVCTECFPFWTGITQRVETREGDDVFYARVDRGLRPPIWGRFVRGRKGQLTRSQTVILRPVCDVGPVGWTVVAAYVGDAAPPFPGDPFETASSREYWATHALLDGVIPYRNGTETTRCPWGPEEVSWANGKVTVDDIDPFDRDLNYPDEW